MIAQVITENGQKKIKPLTADAGAGNPVGSYLYLEKKSNPQGYLYCDGSTFDETVYPLLYAYLGSNVLPDWREFSAVGAEQNTTNVYDAQTNPNGVIHDHDVFTEGQAKDDQLQGHAHGNILYSQQNTPGGAYASLLSGNNDTDGRAYSMVSGRRGTTTRGKRKAVYIYIKATSGLSENAQDNVVAQLNEERSYSTSEVNTGKKWIDGKDIFKKTYAFENITLDETARVIGTVSGFTEADVVKKEILVKRQGIVASEDNMSIYLVNGSIYAWQKLTSTTTGFTVIYTLEYTKTTD